MADHFNVQDDFNNNGPRYSLLYGGQTDTDMAQLAARTGRPYSSYTDNLSTFSYDDHGPKQQPPQTLLQSTMQKDGYKALYDPYQQGHDDSQVEMVTVPALGAEWSKNELYNTSKRGRNAERREDRRKAWMQWNRDQRGCCGIGWLTKRMAVIIGFISCVALALLLYFLLPRTPSFDFPTEDSSGFFIADNSSVVFSRTPTNFSFTGDLKMSVDASSSYLPVYFNKMEYTVYDIVTNKAVGTGEWKDYTLPHTSNQLVTLPVEYSYTAVNASDATWLDWYGACGHIWTGTTRNSLSLRITLKMYIRGLVTRPTVSRLVTGLTCPFELASDSV